MNLLPVLEGILFLVGDDGINLDRLKEVLEIEEKEIKELIEKLKEKYEKEDSGLSLEYLGGKYKITTKKEHKEYYERLTETEENAALTPATLETLVIIAYNQPITRIKVDEIRGVFSGNLIRRLVLKDLVKEVGKSDGPGRPNLYGTTDRFLDYFGLKTIDELPKIESEEEIDEEKNLFESKYTEE